MRSLTALLGIFMCMSLVGCVGGDFDLEKIFEIEAQNPGEGDGDLTFYSGAQVISPVPTIHDTDDVELGFIIEFRPGPSAVVPTSISYTIKGLTDAGLPIRLGKVDLIYVPAPPPAQVAPEAWCVFDPATCAALFTEAAYTAGDYYYAYKIVNMGVLPVGTHDFQICIDPDDVASPEDDLEVIKFSNVTVTVVSLVQAPN